MAKVSSKLGSIEVPYAHMWKDRDVGIMFERTPLISQPTRVATIGSCFAEELAAAMTRLGLKGAMHPGGLFYTSRSIRQEMARIFERDTRMLAEPPWKVKAGYVDPFHSYTRGLASLEQLRESTKEVDRRADELFRGADLYVITLGLIESWQSPTTGLAFRQIPHPDVFEEVRAEMRRLTVQEMIDDLHAIRGSIRKHTQAPIVFTVSPVPLHTTFTKDDIRIANTESKSRIRAAVSEFIESHPDVHYFHSYEIVSTAERASDFMLEDGRHVHRHAVDYILNEFLRKFAGGDVDIPEIDKSWLTPPSKTAARAELGTNGVGKRMRRVASRIWQGLPDSVRQSVRSSVSLTRR